MKAVLFQLNFLRIECECGGSLLIMLHIKRLIYLARYSQHKHTRDSNVTTFICAVYIAFCNMIECDVFIHMLLPFDM